MHYQTRGEGENGRIKDLQVTYDTDKSKDGSKIEASVAYGLWSAMNKGNGIPISTIQYLIWSSGKYQGLDGYIPILDEYDPDDTTFLERGYDSNNKEIDIDQDIKLGADAYAQFYYWMLSGGRKSLIEQINVINDKSQVFIDQSSKDNNCIVGPYRFTLKQEVIDSINESNAKIDEQNKIRDDANEDTVKSNEELIKENKNIVSENQNFESYNNKIDTENDEIDDYNENSNNDNSMPEVPDETPTRTQKNSGAIENSNNNTQANNKSIISENQDKESSNKNLDKEQTVSDEKDIDANLLYLKIGNLYYPYTSDSADPFDGTNWIRVDEGSGSGFKLPNSMSIYAVYKDDKVNEENKVNEDEIKTKDVKLEPNDYTLENVKYFVCGEQIITVKYKGKSLKIKISVNCRYGNSSDGPVEEREIYHQIMASLNVPNIENPNNVTLREWNVNINKANELIDEYNKKIDEERKRCGHKANEYPYIMHPQDDNLIVKKEAKSTAAPLNSDLDANTSNYSVSDLSGNAEENVKSYNDEVTKYNSGVEKYNNYIKDLNIKAKNEKIQKENDEAKKFNEGEMTEGFDTITGIHVPPQRVGGVNGNNASKTFSSVYRVRINNNGSDSDWKEFIGIEGILSYNSEKNYYEDRCKKIKLPKLDKYILYKKLYKEYEQQKKLVNCKYHIENVDPMEKLSQALRASATSSTGEENPFKDIMEFIKYEIKVEGENANFLDKDGKPIDFPNWGEDFYISFKKTDDILDIHPKISLKYINNFTAEGSVYRKCKAITKEAYGSWNRKRNEDGTYAQDIHGDIKDFIWEDELKDKLYISEPINPYGSSSGFNYRLLEKRDVTIYNIEGDLLTHYIDEDEHGNKIPDMVSDGMGGFVECKYYDNVTYSIKLGITHLPEIQTLYQFGGEIEANWTPIEEDIDLGPKDISIEIGGHTWLDGPANKTGEYDGIGDKEYSGMLVQLYTRPYESNSWKLVNTTSTDKNGKYKFKNLNPFNKYYVQFIYNGQVYQSSLYQYKIASLGKISNAKDISSDSSSPGDKKSINRETFNKRFEKIDSTGKNYKFNGANGIRAYPLLSKLKTSTGEYIHISEEEATYDKPEDYNGVLTFIDAWNKFESYATSEKTLEKEEDESEYKDFYEEAYTKLEEWLQKLNVSQEETSAVIAYIKDCMMNASTYVNEKSFKNGKVEYPVYDKFYFQRRYDSASKSDIRGTIIRPDKNKTYTLDKLTFNYLYTNESDQGRFVDYVICRREFTELAIQKDISKVTFRINTKDEVYKYDKKQLKEGVWTIKAKASDILYNGEYSYERALRPSELLFDGNGDDVKKLQVFVTYRIAIKNNSQGINAKINEIVDYFDNTQYEYVDHPLCTNNTYIGTVDGSKIGDLKVSESSNLGNGINKKTLQANSYDYNSLYLSGIKTEGGKEIFEPGDIGFAFITFKVVTDKETNRVKIDQSLENEKEIYIGKRNIAEINGYSTYYRNDAEIPDRVDSGNKKVSGKLAGIVDTISSPGNLSTKDLKENGDIIISQNEQENRSEPDTDKAPNLKLVIDKTNPRKIQGFVFEDKRDTKIGEAIIGNGTYTENVDKKVNGVKVELVELVSEANSDGSPTGNYTQEKVWGTEEFSQSPNGLQNVETNNDRYWSGYGKSKVILTGTPKMLQIESDNITENNGEYSFKSVPPGDFFIRFTYGDNVQTVLTNKSNEVNELLNNYLNSINQDDSSKKWNRALNDTSYNGQDYKSTIYGGPTSGNYNGINGYKNTENQNFYIYHEDDNLNELKSKMYLYDVGSARKNVSDAKDIYGNNNEQENDRGYRTYVNNWSRGIDVSGNQVELNKEGTHKEQSLLNNKAEILASFEKLATIPKAIKEKKNATQEEIKNAEEQQIQMVEQLIDNTKMIAQTGVMNTEVEYNSKTTEQAQNTDGKVNEYVIDDVDLGLVERPRAQLKLNKEIVNFKVSLSNGNIIFDTNQSVNNLYFAPHEGHSVKYEDKTDITKRKLTSYQIGGNSEDKPELLQAILDEELISGANIQATYKFTVENVGEVDYKDKIFYYIGMVTDASNNNISKTNARTVVDYVSNLIQYEERHQEQNDIWSVKNPEELTSSSRYDKENNRISTNGDIDKDYVNRHYLDRVSSYNRLITTNKLSGDLLPKLIADANQSSRSTTLVLTKTLANTTSSDEEFIYNNLAEIVETYNEQGRRMQFSVVGNQEMADQSIKTNNADTNAKTAIKIITPSEIDADSAQKIVILPPTGENKNYIPIVITLISALTIVILGVIAIKKIIL